MSLRHHEEKQTESLTWLTSTVAATWLPVAVSREQRRPARSSEADYMQEWIFRWVLLCQHPLRAFTYDFLDPVFILFHGKFFFYVLPRIKLGLE